MSYLNIQPPKEKQGLNLQSQTTRVSRSLNLYGSALKLVEINLALVEAEENINTAAADNIS